MKLIDRLHWAKDNLPMVMPQYAVVFENPDDPEASCCVLHPDPNWLAAALHGDILPPIDSYLRDYAKMMQWVAEHPGESFSWDKVGGAEHPYAEPIVAMTEEEAMEYLIMKDIPPQVWAIQRNRPYLKIVRRSMVPADRDYRNAWRMKNAA